MSTTSWLLTRVVDKASVITVCYFKNSYTPHVTHWKAATLVHSEWSLCICQMPYTPQSNEQSKQTLICRLRYTILSGCVFP